MKEKFKVLILNGSPRKDGNTKAANHTKRQQQAQTPAFKTMFHLLLINRSDYLLKLLDADITSNTTFKISIGPDNFF